MLLVTYKIRGLGSAVGHYNTKDREVPGLNLLSFCSLRRLTVPTISVTCMAHKAHVMCIQHILALSVYCNVISNKQHCYLSIQGCATDRSISRRPFLAKAWVRSQVILLGILNGKLTRDKFINEYLWLSPSGPSHHCSRPISSSLTLCTRVGTLILATIYLQLIQNRYMFRSFTVLHCSHQHCVQPVASDVEVVGYL